LFYMQEVAIIKKMTAQPTVERRKFFRHPISVPVQYREVSTETKASSLSVDVSDGGLSFKTNKPIEKGTCLSVMIPVNDELFSMKGYVAYSTPMSNGSGFRTGISFLDTVSKFRAKLAEQMLQIQSYQKKLEEKLHQQISEEEAAQRWVEKHAARFSAFF